MFRYILKFSLISIFLFLVACSSTPETQDGDENNNLDIRVNPPSKDDGSGDNLNNGTGGVGDLGDSSGLTGGQVAYDLNDPYGLGYSDEYLRSLGIDRDPAEYDTIYFPYNSSSIGARGKIILEAHARKLQSYGATNIVLEGHADERGTREYNLALGERRAQSAQDLLNAAGTGTSPVQVLSYGEERPVILEQNEDAWRANRRVQILY